MKNNKKVLVTEELFLEISQQNSSRIALLQGQKEETKEIIQTKREQLADLLEQKRQLESKLCELRESLQESKTEKYKLYKDIVKEKRLSKKINNAFTRKLEINLSKFIREESQTKRR